MTITLPGLLHADTAALRATADRWEQVVAAVDTTVDDLGRATRELPDHWSSGPGAEAAEQEAGRLRIRIGNAHQHCHQIALTVRRFADDLDHLRRTLHSVVDEAAGKGVRVDLATGQVTLSATAPPGDDGAYDLLLAQYGGPAGAQARIDGYLRQLDEILAAANQADQRGSRLLDDHVLGERDTPPAEMRFLDEVALAAVPRNLEIVNARWWDAQHPLNQQRAITEHPELIGAGPGLPSDARDAANRILLQRQRDTLLARRQELLGAQAGRSPEPGQRELVRHLDDRLEAVDGLQRRLADPHQPKVYLNNYPPGYEERAVLTRGDGKWDRTDVALDAQAGGSRSTPSSIRK